MILEDKKYQETAIDTLILSVADLLQKDTKDKVCIFQSPTGSGKTVMVAKFIEGLIREYPNLDFCFLWASIGKGELHKQSKKSLEKIFNGSPNCVLVEQEFFGTRSFIKRNEVVVANWEGLRNKDKKTGEWSNKIMRDGEMISFVEVLENTKDKRHLQKITVQKEDYNPNIIKHLKATRNNIYKALALPSYYKNRVDFGDLTLSFGKTLDKVFCEGFGIEINPLMINTVENGEKVKKQGLTLDSGAYKEGLIIDKKIDGKNFDEIEGDVENDYELLDIQLAENDLLSKFEEIIKEN